MNRLLTLTLVAALAAALACSGRDAGTTDTGTSDVKTDAVVTDVKTDTVVKPDVIVPIDTATPEADGATQPDVATETPAEGTVDDTVQTETTDDATEVAETSIPAGAITVQSSGNKLPDPWLVTDAAVLKQDNSGTGASAHGNQLVKLNTQTTVSIDPCPLPYTSASGKTYCDGFNATDSGSNTVVVDTFSFLGTSPACTVPTSGTLESITGIWGDSYDSKTKIDTWDIELADCSGIGLATPYAGTGTPADSKDIQNLPPATPTGSQVTVSGVVVATWTASTAWGFNMMDPAGGENSGIAVEKGPSSTSSAAQPQVGDYVTVTGAMKHLGMVLMRIDI